MKKSVTKQAIQELQEHLNQSYFQFVFFAEGGLEIIAKVITKGDDVIFKVINKICK